MMPIKKFYYSQLNELKTYNKSFVSEQENKSKLASSHSNIKKVSLLLMDKNKQTKKLGQTTIDFKQDESYHFRKSIMFQYGVVPFIATELFKNHK